MINQTTKIYKLISQNTNYIYVGITNLSLKERLKNHISSYKTHKEKITYSFFEDEDEDENKDIFYQCYCGSYPIIDKNNYEIILIKDYKQLLNKDVLFDEEKKYIFEYAEKYKEYLTNIQHNAKYGLQIKEQYYRCSLIKYKIKDSKYGDIINFIFKDGGDIFIPFNNINNKKIIDKIINDGYYIEKIYINYDDYDDDDEYYYENKHFLLDGELIKNMHLEQ